MSQRSPRGATLRHIVGSVLGRSNAGRYLKQAIRSREERAWARRRPPEAPVLFIVGEKDTPYRYAPFFYSHWLDWVARNDPELRSQIHLAHLPTEPPPNVAALHAWVQDPVRERDAALFGQLVKLQERVRDSGAEIIQPVEALSNSLRDRQYECLARVGIRTPRVAHIDARFAEEFAGLTLPIVIRKNWGHQAGMRLLDSEAQCARWLEEHRHDLSGWVAAEYLDVRGADGYYRKYRYILFGEHGVCRHMLVSANWEVRPSDRILTEETITEELAFVDGPCDLHGALNAARRELEFDIAAFDYSFDACGEPIVWEVNPYPDLSRPRGRPGEYLGESIERTNLALAAFYRDRLGIER